MSDAHELLGSGDVVQLPYAEPPTTPAGGDPAADLIRRIVREEMAAMAKQEQVIGWVTGLDPLTVKLLTGGDVLVTLKDASLALQVGDRVSLLNTGTGYMITGLAAAPEDDQLTSGGVVPIGAVVLWPASQAIPDGWEEATDLRGRFVVSPDGVSFLSGTTGGAATHEHDGASHDHAITSAANHNHGGETGTPTATVQKVNTAGQPAASQGHRHSISDGGAHDHGGWTEFAALGVDNNDATSAESHLPPWSAVYLWIRRIA